MVVILCLQEVGSSLEGSGTFHPIQCDVSDEDQICEMFKRIRKEHGGVDICINNAGLSWDAPLLSGKTDQWKSMIDVSTISGFSINSCISLTSQFQGSQLTLVNLPQEACKQM